MLPHAGRDRVEAEAQPCTRFQRDQFVANVGFQEFDCALIDSIGHEGRVV